MEDKMSLKEAGRLSIMRQVDKKLLTLRRASEEMGLSLRQTKRIRKRYLEKGEQGLISLKRGQESNRKICKKRREKAVRWVRARYFDFGPTLACEKLEQHGIKVSAETVRKWLIEEGIWRPKKKKERRVYQRRERRSRFGELLQGDGSSHDWLEGRGPRCTLLHFVDDATSRTTVARFVNVENEEGYLEILKAHLLKYGRPLGLYVDKHATFRVNREEIKKGVGITHFGNVMKALEIELICANSPQAKGRIERKNGLFQDRLIKEMRLKKICTIEEANRFLPLFIEEMNRRFGKEAKEPEDAHRPLRAQEDLKRIFARKEKRKLSKEMSFQHRGILYLIQSKSPNRLRHAYVDVFYREGEAIEVEYNGVKLKYKKWSETVYQQPQVRDHKEVAMSAWTYKKSIKPRRNHPWR